MNSKQVEELMTEYFAARRAGDKDKVWSLLYDHTGGDQKEGFYSHYEREKGYLPNYELVSVGTPERNEKYDADQRWNGGWRVIIKYKDWREKEIEIFVHEADGKILLNCAKRI